MDISCHLRRAEMQWLKLVQKLRNKLGVHSLPLQWWEWKEDEATTQVSQDMSQNDAITTSSKCGQRCCFTQRLLRRNNQKWDYDNKYVRTKESSQKTQKEIISPKLATCRRWRQMFTNCLASLIEVWKGWPLKVGAENKRDWRLRWQGAGLGKSNDRNENRHKWDKQWVQ